MNYSNRKIGFFINIIYEHIWSRWDGNKTLGVVGAIVLIPGYNGYIIGRAYYDTVRQSWIHGERDAIEQALIRLFWMENPEAAKLFEYREVLELIQGHRLPAGCVMITNLEPCSLDMAKRFGCSCSNLIEYHQFSKVYCGVRDPKHIGVDGQAHSHPFDIVFLEDTAKPSTKAIKQCLELRKWIPNLNE